MRNSHSVNFQDVFLVLGFFLKPVLIFWLQNLRLVVCAVVCVNCLFYFSIRQRAGAPRIRARRAPLWHAPLLLSHSRILAISRQVSSFILEDGPAGFFSWRELQAHSHATFMGPWVGLIPHGRCQVMTPSLCPPGSCILSQYGLCLEALQEAPSN